MVDVVDSKSTAGDSVPVRVRSPAPKKRAPRGLSFLVSGRRTRTHQNATVQWTVATRRFRRVLHSALESGCRHHCPKSLVFQRFWAFFFPVFSAWGERNPYRFAAALSGDNRRSDPNILPRAGFLHKFFAVSFRLFSAGQSKIETQHTGRSQRVRGNGVPTVTVSTEAFAKSGRPPIITARRCDTELQLKSLKKILIA